jgi:tRNA(Ile)-lysidine synthase
MSSNNGLPELEKKAGDTIVRYNMLKGANAVLVGVSGGADSSALLHFLCRMREKTGIKVYAAHVNHELRGAEADRDEQFVKKLCEENNAELFVLHKDVKALAKQTGKTVEEAGREVRYKFFRQKAEQTGAVIATAHTLSDSIETQLMCMARGTGLHGLCGIPPVRKNIIRPLIRCVRRDTEEYCHFYGIKYVDDSTNFSREFTRNRLRLDVVPVFYELNPSFDKAAARLIDSLEEDEQYLETEAKMRLKAAKISENEFDVSVLKDCPAAILKRCAAIATETFSGKAQEAKHINAIVGIIQKGEGKIEIRGACFAEVRTERLIFSKHNDIISSKEQFNFPFCVGIYQNCIYKLIISTIPHSTLKNLKNVNKEYLKNAVDCDKIIGNASVRGRLQGDKFKPAGRNVTKSLKKLFNEAKVPIRERACVPVAADESGVIWVGGFGASERCKVTEGTENAVLLEIKRLEE